MERRGRDRLLRMRDAFKARLAPRQLRALRGLEAGFADACARVLSILPTRQQATIKERLTPVGHLDYASADIVLELSASTELLRLRSCTKEPETIAWLEQVLRPGDVVFDIGANVGAYSLVADRICAGDCKVFAFEPSYSSFASLSRNIQLNGVSGRVVPLQVALADRTQILEFQYRDVRAGAAEHAWNEDHNQGRFQPSYVQPTLGYRLDDFVQAFGLPLPDIVKIDVDGGEECVLAGASKVLRAPKLRSLQIEIDERLGKEPQIRAELAGLGFVVMAERRRPSGIVNVAFARQPG